MKSTRYRAIPAVLLLAALTLLSGCAMIAEMANTPADGYGYGDTSSEPDPYYRGHSNDTSAPGIK